MNFGYVYYRWNADNVSCSTKLQNVNVLFYVKLSNSVASLVIKEDPTLAKVIGIVESPASYEGACYGPDGCNLFVGIPLQQEMTLLGKQSDNQNSIGLSYQECQDKIGNEIQKVVESINKSKAILLATRSSDFQSKVNGYKYVFSNIFTNMTENQKTCDDVKLTSVVVEFSILNSTSNFIKFTQVGEDPTILQVTFVEDVFVQKCNDNCALPSPPAENIIQKIPSPLRQIAGGTAPQDVKCFNGFTLVIKSEDVSPACVKPESVSKLIERGWAKVQSGLSEQTKIGNPSSALKLHLSMNSTVIQPGQTIAINVWINNTSSDILAVNSQDDWLLKGLGLHPCERGLPFGVGLFEGNYSLENIVATRQLPIYQNGTYNCPSYQYSTVNTYVFQPGSSNAVLVTPDGNFTSGIAYGILLNGFYDNNHLEQLKTGTYTIVGGDEWGHIEVQHFTVTENR